jgi:hypothetical protein
MHDYGLADFDGMLSFQAPENPDHVSYSVVGATRRAAGVVQLQVKSLETIMSELGHDQVDMLKLDIEGAEYAVIESMARGAVRPTHILLELHHRLPGIGVEKSRAALGQLRQMGYLLYSVSANGEEFSLMRA